MESEEAGRRERMTRARVLGLILAASAPSALASCGEDVDVVYVEPNVIDGGQATEVRVFGSGFTWTYDAFTDTAAATFEVRVSDRVIDDVEWIDAGELKVLLPADVASGVHSVTVTVDDRSDTEAEALFVREPPAGS